MNVVDELLKIERDVESLNRRLTGARESIASITASDVSIVDAGGYFTGIEVEAALQESGIVGRVLNGSTVIAIALTITEAGGVVTANLSSSVGNTIVMKFSSGFIDVDVTAPKTVVVTHGTDINPTVNYLYVLASDPTTLVKSTVSFPAVEHLRCAKIFCQSAASVQADGCYKEHVFSDHTYGATGGHISMINHWLRAQWAHWESGVAPTFSGTGTATIGYASTAGIVGQLHDKVFPLFADPAEVYAINDPDTAYRKITNIGDLLKDSTGAVLKNRTYGLVFWGVLNDNGESNIFCTLPSGSEIGENNARQDKNKYIDYGIPTEFRGVGFLEYRLIIKNNNDNTWTLYTGGTGDDLRGQIPATSAGSTTAIGINFPDGASGFTLFNATDITKEVQVDLSGLTTGNTRTVTFPDRDLDLGNPIFDSITSLGNVHLDDDSIELRLGAEVNDYTIQWDGSDAIHTIVAGDFVFTGGNFGIGTPTPSGALDVESGTFPVFDLVRTGAETATLKSVGRIMHETTGNMVDGFGANIVFGGTDAGTSNRYFGSVGCIRDGADTEGALVFKAGTGGGEEFMRIDKDANVGIKTSTFQAACVGVLAIKEGTAPGGATADQGYLWVQDDLGTAEMYVQDGGGVQTKISPHNEFGEWEFWSKNIVTGKIIKINMERMIRKLETYMDETFIEEFYEQAQLN